MTMTTDTAVANPGAVTTPDALAALEAQNRWIWTPPFPRRWNLVGADRQRFWSAYATHPENLGHVTNQFGTRRPASDVGRIQGFAEAGYRVDYVAPRTGFFLVAATFRVESVTNQSGGGTCHTRALLGVRGADGYHEALRDLPAGGNDYNVVQTVVSVMEGGRPTTITAGSAIEIRRRYTSPDYWRTYGEVIGKLRQLLVVPLLRPEDAEDVDVPAALATANEAPETREGAEILDQSEVDEEATLRGDA